jgi:nucleoside-diphosphate-sugar epimerase
MNEVIAMIEEISGEKAHITREERQLGDVTNTGADVSRAVADFQYTPKTSLREGLEKEIQYIRDFILANKIPAS